MKPVTRDEINVAFFGPDDMSRGLCKVCGGMDAHSSPCYENQWCRDVVRRRLGEARDRVMALLFDEEES